MSSKKRKKVEIKSVDFSDNKEEDVPIVEQTNLLKDSEEPEETTPVVAEDDIEINIIEDCKETTDLLKDGRYPTAILLETEKPGKCFVEIKLLNNTNFRIKMETIKNHNDYFGHVLTNQICTTHLIPMQFKQIVRTNAKVHLFYSKANPLPVANDSRVRGEHKALTGNDNTDAVQK